MFKVKNKWVVEDGSIPILEKYGFKVFNDNSEHKGYVIEINKHTMYVFVSELILEGSYSLSLFYKLIKDDILEEVQDVD